MTTLSDIRRALAGSELVTLGGGIPAVTVTRRLPHADGTVTDQSPSVSVTVTDEGDVFLVTGEPVRAARGWDNANRPGQWFDGLDDMPGAFAHVYEELREAWRAGGVFSYRGQQ